MGLGISGPVMPFTQARPVINVCPATIGSAGPVKHGCVRRMAASPTCAAAISIHLGNDAIEELRAKHYSYHIMASNH